MSTFRYQIQAEFHLPFIFTGFLVPTLFDFILQYLTLLYSYFQKIQNFIYGIKTKEKKSVNFP